MQADDFDSFSEVVQGVHSFYGRDASSFALDVWWQALNQYDLVAIRDAFGRHCVNPDTGQFIPKPADVVKMLEGSTMDSAVVAWTKVERAVSHVGTYTSVVFDDALIHAVIDDMGGWTLLGKKPVDEWPFVGKEFQTRYRGYRSRRATPKYPPCLMGILDAENSRRGFDLSAPTLIGIPVLAKRVMICGTDEPRIAFTRGAEAAALIERKDEAA